MIFADPLFLDSVWVTVAAILLVVIGSIVQAVFGMGFGLTVAPMLAILDPAMVPGTTLYIGMLSATLGMKREWQQVRWDEVRTGIGGRIAGVVIGAIIILQLNDRNTFSLVFGIVIAIGVLLSAGGWKLPFTKRNLWLMSGTSGLMGVITSVGAPPMALIYQNRSVTSARPTMSAFFATGCAISLSGLYLIGATGLRELLFALILVPPMMIGTTVGRKFGKLDHAGFRLGLLSISGFASLLLIARGLGWW